MGGTRQFTGSPQFVKWLPHRRTRPSHPPKQARKNARGPITAEKTIAIGENAPKPTTPAQITIAADVAISLIFGRPDPRANKKPATKKPKSGPAASKMTGSVVAPVRESIRERSICATRQQRSEAAHPTIAAPTTTRTPKITHPQRSPRGPRTSSSRIRRSSSTDGKARGRAILGRGTRSVYHTTNRYGG